MSSRVFRPVHPLAHLVNVGEHLLLLFLQALEAALEVFALLLALGLLERGLQFLQTFIQILLATRELLQAVHHLELFLALGVLRSLGLTLGLVTILRLGEIELVELPLVLLASATAAALFAGARDVRLAGLQFQQRLIRRLLGGQSLGERRGRFCRLRQRLDRLLHFARDGRKRRLRLG